MLLHSLAHWQHYYTQRKTKPKLPQGLQLVNIILVVLDILWKLFIHVICYPSKIFIECKASVSSPCLASISKVSMRLKGLTWFDCGSQF